jgi:hypothetical protein
MAPKEQQIRGELIAVVLIVVVSAIGATIFIGISIGFWAAMIVTAGFALAALAAVIVWATRRRSPSAADAPHVQPLHDGRYRILVLADENCATSGFIDELLSHGVGEPVSIFVMAPALNLGRFAGEQKAYEMAARHLEETLDGLEEAGLSAQGEIGPSDPLQACDDGLRQFPADEIVFATHPTGTTNWLEGGWVERAEARYDQPVKHVVVAASTATE